MTQLLHEVLAEVRNIKHIDTKGKATEEEAQPVQRDPQDREQQGLVLEQLQVRCQEYERREDDLKEKVRELADRRDCLEAQVREVERESAGHQQHAAEQVQRLESEKRTLESELEKVHTLSSIKGSLESQVQTLNNLKGSLETQARQREKELSVRLAEATEVIRRLEDEKRTLRGDLDGALEQLGLARNVEHEANARQQQMAARCQELERSEEELRAQVHALSRRASLQQSSSLSEDRERELVQRLNEALEHARTSEAERRALEAQVGNPGARHQQQEIQDLRGRAAGLEEQLKAQFERIRQLELEKQELQSQHRQERRQSIERESSQRPHRQSLPETGKETKLLQKELQDQQKIVWELENEVRQVRQASFTEPGEFLRLVKAFEGENLAVENGKLKKALALAQSDLEVCKRTLSEQKDLQQKTQR